MVLAATWNPRGEIQRLERMLARLHAAYAAIFVSLPSQPDDPGSQAQLLDDLAGEEIICCVNQDWSGGRYTALKMAVEYNSRWIHYADMDRLLRWVERSPGEWLQTLDMIPSCDYLVIGRTPDAYATHPQVLIQTEALSNAVISYLVGQSMDVSAGSKGFSHQAARYVIENTQPGHALGTDGEWTVLLHRAGFQIAYVEVAGLDWESADRYQMQPANPSQQRRAAVAYDADPANWAQRTAVAEEIIRFGLLTANREIPTINLASSES